MGQDIERTKVVVSVCNVRKCLETPFQGPELR
jgi:hypothetical protein